MLRNLFYNYYNWNVFILKFIVTLIKPISGKQQKMMIFFSSKKHNILEKGNLPISCLGARYSHTEILTSKVIEICKRKMIK
jgi:hypothetical protein